MVKSHTKETVALNLLAIPVLTFFGIRISYRMLDSAYGEWLIYENNLPKYYLNIFDPEYASLRKNTLDSGIDVVEYLKEKITPLNSRLMFSDNIIGIKFNNRASIKSISVEKIPNEFLKYF